jgi:hypothetical protein
VATDIRLDQIISKMLAVILTKLLHDFISLGHFGFLEGRQIYKAIVFAKESLHSIKIKKMSTMLIKLDLSKAYNRVF